MKMSQFSPLLLALFSGVAAVVGIRLPHFGWAVVLVPFFLLLAVRRSGVTTAQAALYGFICGVLLMLAATGWIGFAFPILAKLPLPKIYGVLFIAFTWSATVTVSATGVAAFAVLAHRLRLPLYSDILVLSVAWPVFEFIRMFLFSLLSAGSGVLDTPHFSFGFLGYSLADYDALLQIGRFGGVYALSGFVAAVGVGLYWLYTAKEINKRLPLGALTLAVVFGLGLVIPLSPFLHVLTKGNEKIETVAVVTRYKSLTPPYPLPPIDTHLFNSATLTVLSEETAAYPPFASSTVPVSLVGKAFPFTTTIIDSGTVEDSDGTKLERSTAVSKRGVAFLRDKAVIVPYGEYTPALFRLFARAFGVEGVLNDFQKGRRFRPGTLVAAAPAGDLRVSTLFCYEVAVPQLAKEVVDRTGANIIAVVAAHTWFRGAQSLHTDVLRMTKVQAVSAGVPIARSSQDDSAFVVDRFGRVLYSESRKNGGVAVVSVPVAVHTVSK